jgi:acyl-CoA thioester hydrolase
LIFPLSDKYPNIYIFHITNYNLMAKVNEFIHEVRIQYRDVDSAGHVNNATYLHFLEDIRMEFLKTVCGKYDCEDIDFVLAHLTINYHSRSSYREILQVIMRPIKIGNTSWTFSYRIIEKKTKRLVCDGVSIQVLFDYLKGVKKQIPSNLRKKLNMWL